MSMNSDSGQGFQLRLIRLEENVFFQDKKLQELDDEMREMQNQLQSLLAKTSRLEEAYMRLHDFMSSQTATGPDTLPPHYQQDK